MEICVSAHEKSGLDLIEWSKNLVIEKNRK